MATHGRIVSAASGSGGAQLRQWRLYQNGRPDKKTTNPAMKSYLEPTEYSGRIVQEGHAKVGIFLSLPAVDSKHAG